MNPRVARALRRRGTMAGAISELETDARLMLLGYAPAPTTPLPHFADAEATLLAHVAAMRRAGVIIEYDPHRGAWYTLTADGRRRYFTSW